MDEVTVLDVIALATICCPEVAPVTLDALVQHESRADALAIHLNGPAQLSRQPTTVAEAIDVAIRLTAAGINFDAGLGQINSTHIRTWGTSWATVFDACGNLQLATTVLTDCYMRAPPALDGQHRLAAALSCYNTGNFKDGFENGYVARVYAAAAAKGVRSHNASD